MLPLTKTIIYPTTLVYDVGHDLLWSAAINLVAESLIILSVMLLSKKTDKTLFELVENTFGNVGARIVYGLFAVFFIVAAALPIMEQKSFVLTVFYENVPSFISFAPFFALSLFASIKGIKSIGRMADVLMPIFDRIVRGDHRLFAAPKRNSANSCLYFPQRPRQNFFSSIPR